jgi:Transcriptional regulator PadR-like family
MARTSAYYVVDNIYHNQYIVVYMKNEENSDAERFLPLKPNWFHVLPTLANEEQHGYGIMQEVLEQTNGKIRLRPATLYGTLERLLDEGLIAVRLRLIHGDSGGVCLALSSAFAPDHIGK